MQEAKDIQYASRLLSKKVSFQETAFAPITAEESVADVLDSIKNGKYAKHVRALRAHLANGNIDRYQSEKVLLPCVTFCGTFKEKRRRDHLKEYNEILVIDIDNISSANELLRFRETLFDDPYIACIWQSPSRNGLKGLVEIKYPSRPLDKIDINDLHRLAFSAFSQYISETYHIELDQSGSDTTRLCFYSYDIGLILKSSWEPFVVNEEQFLDLKAKKQTPLQDKKAVRILPTGIPGYFLNPLGRNKPADRKTMQSIVKYLEKRRLSITGDCASWVKAAFAISDSFTYDIGSRYFLRLCRLDGQNHDEIKSENLLRYCYENSKGIVSFSSIVHEARSKGYGAQGGSEGGH